MSNSCLKDTSVLVESPVQDMTIVEGLTIPEFVWNYAENWKSEPCLECAITGRIYTYKDIYNQSRTFASRLLEIAKLKNKDTLSLILPNCPEFVIAIFGAWEIGCVVSPVNPIYTKNEIVHQLKNAEVKCVITTEDFLPIIHSARESLPDLETIIFISDTQDISTTHENAYNFQQFLSSQIHNGSEALPEYSIDSDDTALLLYSSGTTGMPKGVMLTHSNFCNNVKQISHPEFCVTKTLENDAEMNPEIIFGLLPFFHSYGLVVLVCGMIQGSKIISLPKFQTETFIKAIKKYKPTVLHLVTPLIDVIVNTPELDKRDFENCKAIVFSAAPAGNSLISKVFDKIGKSLFIQQGYGMTEFIFSHLVQPKVDNIPNGSIGPLLPGNQAKVVDSDTGISLAAYQQGELWIKGPSVMKGYFKNEKATKETLDSDGFLHTGDLVYYDKNGWFYILDRIKDIMKVRGFQVSPSEIEDHLRKHPSIADVAVIGVPLNYDEVPRAYIVIKKNHSLSESDVKKILVDKVAPYKQLMGGVAFISEIPRSAAGKILRKNLLKEYLSAQ